MNKEKEPYIIIYQDKSILNDSDGSVHEYSEGKLSNDALQRNNEIKTALENKYLEKIIQECYTPNVSVEINEEHAKLISNLVESITSEVGRAVVGLTALQLTIKSLNKAQSIRLHKGSSSNGSFSWKEGISMRTLDKNYITPILRKYDLLRLNADGFMMTRTLAENYPYSKLYKAAIRGNRKDWISIVDLVENDYLDATNALKYFVIQLIQKSNKFKTISNKLIDQGNVFLAKRQPDLAQILIILDLFIKDSAYSARIFEIVMHAFFQTLDDKKVFEGFLVPLSQMRSANKKHGNIGDIEISFSKGKNDIIESWDAKYGKTYLREEIEELNEKLENHSVAKLVGFVTNSKPDLKEEIKNRMEELELIHDIKILILTFHEWVYFQIDRYNLDSETIVHEWLINIIKTITLNKEEAPIDEPTNLWIEELAIILDRY